MVPETVHEAAIICEDDVKYERVKKKGYVRLVTNLGQLNFELYCDVTPKACDNFIKHCLSGYYNGTKFHRMKGKKKNLNTYIVVSKSNLNHLQQFSLQCCGIYGVGDWAANGQPIPSTCCAGREILDNKPTECTADSPSIHKNGCLDLILSHMKELALVLGGVGIGIAFVQLLGVIFACCLARSIRSQYETV
ncbi:unnamed protein product [Euphydryas editha]|uniref:PPIase cyclophilin-type domain-containing protein n=1 Tax=Euphydryas editha TaxID=104508 RepID=A0AAU9TIM2_EUPED|nr:unnamed protein product [Euphydryas editha]